MKKLRDALEFLKGRLAGQNKEDVEMAISMVSLQMSLSDFRPQLTQRLSCFHNVVKLRSIVPLLSIG